MSDLIDRQAAIEALIDTFTYIDPMALIDVISKLPSAQPEVIACGEGELSTQPERKKGKWIEKSERLAPLNTIWWDECSVCGHHAFNRMTTDFCPNCGALMEG